MKLGSSLVATAVLALTALPVSAQSGSAKLSVSVVVAPSCRVAVGSNVSLQCAGRAEQSARADGKEVPGLNRAGARSFEVRQDANHVVHLNF